MASNKNINFTFFELLDVRCKLVCLSLLSLCLLGAGPISLAGTLVMLALLHKNVFERFPLKETVYLLPMLILIFLARGLTTPGETLISIISIPITRQGAWDGLLIALRLLAIVFLSLLFSGTTKASQVKIAAQWLLKPIPLIPEKRAAVMIGLFFRFMPLLTKQAREISLACQARCGNLQKNPIKRLIQTGVPLIQKTFRSADLLALAMEARCYSEERTEQQQIPSGHEPKALCAVLLLGLCLIIF